MKKLYMKQEILSVIDRFYIKDENEEDRYLIEGDYIQVGGKKLHIKDLFDNELLTIKQKLLSLLPKFFVLKNEEQVASIQKKIAFFGSKYIIEGPEWEVKGKIMKHDYTILKDGNEIANIHKAWISWGDSYEITISDNVDDTLVLAVVLAIEMVLEQEIRNADMTPQE